jgi:hypothetical protein
MAFPYDPRKVPKANRSNYERVASVASRDASRAKLIETWEPLLRARLGEARARLLAEAGGVIENIDLSDIIKNLDLSDIEGVINNLPEGSVQQINVKSAFKEAFEKAQAPRPVAAPVIPMAAAAGGSPPTDPPRGPKASFNRPRKSSGLSPTTIRPPGAADADNLFDDMVDAYSGAKKSPVNNMGGLKGVRPGKELAIIPQAQKGIVKAAPLARAATVARGAGAVAAGGLTTGGMLMAGLGGLALGYPILKMLDYAFKGEDPENLAALSQFNQVRGNISEFNEAEANAERVGKGAESLYANQTLGGTIQNEAEKMKRKRLDDLMRSRAKTISAMSSPMDAPSPLEVLSSMRAAQGYTP